MFYIFYDYFNFVMMVFEFYVMCICINVISIWYVLKCCVYVLYIKYFENYFYLSCNVFLNDRKILNVIFCVYFLLLYFFDLF